MAFAFKLSRRLAQNFALAALVALSACHDAVDPRSLPPVHSVSISPSSATIAVASTVRLAASLRDELGGLLEQRVVTWASEAAGVATVTDSGVVRGVAEGATTIRATSEGRSATAVVTVVADSVTPPLAWRAGHYVAPNGTSTGAGTPGQPWDLVTALAGAGGRIGPGDTIWLRGGTYRGWWRPSVSGAPGKPVVVRGYPGERVILDGAGSTKTTLFVTGPYSVYWGFEIINSDPVRTGDRSNVVANYASHTKYINLVVRDGGVAFYNESDYSDVEIVGCIIYNIGWQGTDRGHGHAIYLKSNTGPVIARDNIMFNQFGYGVHVFTNPGAAYLNNIRLEGNVAFNNGTLSTNSTSSNILHGGDNPSTGGALVGNFTYSSPGVAHRNVQVGYGSLQNGTVQVLDNYFVGGATVLDMGYWSGATVTGNTFVGAERMVRLNDGTTSGQVWSGDLFNRDPAAAAWTYAGTSYTFAGWKTATGFATAGQALSGTPPTTRVFVRANPYELGRANIVVYNWARLAAVTIDLAAVLPLGARYEIRNVQDLFGAPVVSGTFAGGPITLPITAVSPPVPIGLTSSRAPSTGIDFGVYVVTIRDG